MSNDPIFELASCDQAVVTELRDKLKLGRTVAEILVRRGISSIEDAHTFLAANTTHPLEAFGGLAEAIERIEAAIANDAQIIVHGDYDVDGVCSTAILVSTLRAVCAATDSSAKVAWYIPSRTEDGYGFSAGSVAKLQQLGCQLAITVDCGITAVEEVELANAAGIEVIVTDHHSARADGQLPATTIVHPTVGGYPCQMLCGAGVAYKLAESMLWLVDDSEQIAQRNIAWAAIATVADVVPIVDENRRIVREGLRELARTSDPGMSALIDVAAVARDQLDTTAIGFRIAPRINAAGRLYRADAGVELLLSDDPIRSREIADELDHANNQRRKVENDIRIEAERQIAELPDDLPAYVLWAEDWHPGVIGIVASRLADDLHRPVIMIALNGDSGSGSGRSIPRFDLLAGLTACDGLFERYGGHKAAAGLTISRSKLEQFRQQFCQYAQETLSAEDLLRRTRVDVIVSVDELTLALAEELQTLAPFGAGNPTPTLAVTNARFESPRLVGDGRHTSFSIVGDSSQVRGIAFGVTSLPKPMAESRLDAAVKLEINHFNGSISPNVKLKGSRSFPIGTIEILGENSDYAGGVLGELERALGQPVVNRHSDELKQRTTATALGERDLNSVLASLQYSDESVLVVASHANHRHDLLKTTGFGGFSLTSWCALDRDSELVLAFDHVILMDPPPHRHLDEIALLGSNGGWIHRTWGESELNFALRVHQWNYTLREPAIEIYRALRDGGPVMGEAAVSIFQGSGKRLRTPALAGRVLRVLSELELIELDRDALTVSVGQQTAHTELEQSPSYRAYNERLEDGVKFLQHANRTLRK